MNRSMITASVTMGQLQNQLDTIANNIANSNTDGFKRRDVQFSSLLAQEINNQPNQDAEIGRLTPEGIRLGSGARVAGTVLRLEQGGIIETGRSLDLALLNPNILFQVQKTLENGDEIVEYTREGSFYLTPVDGNPERLQLTASNGDLVMGENGPIEIPSDFTSISVSGEGLVEVTLADQTTVNAGQLSLVEVIQPQLLESAGENRYRVSETADLNEVIGQPEANGNFIQQGSLEQSNVNLAQEMTQLMTTQRSYQMNARSIKMADQMMGLVNSIR
ncbi:flagellar hook-basal body protein [Alkalihalobacillus sp. AL-G]|uniref:flagellar hook-basal body protein n=1 Tax=Alkalihalobacillus sp. AL-G TaxID=2926399 RepID=UPI00272ACDFA|nr:flagellar hook-basal body protein [Alkalihalobacillus sp. AL-G]WLD93124.1 flagellar hook-basal body protein [Alkalihalobacillus sp. AL-G]